MELAGYPPDPWQRSFLESDAKRRVLLTGRQVGKSQAMAALALHRSLTIPRHLTIVAAQREKSALELIESKLMPLYDALDEDALPARRDSAPTALKTTRFTNDARIEAVAMTPKGVRSFSRVGLVIIDEAAFVPEALFGAMSPFLSRSPDGVLVVASSAGEPSGKFWEICDSTDRDEADGEGSHWTKWQVKSDECPWIPAEHLAAERVSMPAWQFEREYECKFSQAVTVEGMVYPWFSDVTHVGDPPETFVRVVGAVDWGFRKPGALLVLGEAPDGVAWVLDEVYATEQDIDWWVEQAYGLTGEHGVKAWKCDPEDPSNIRKFRAKPLPASEAKNPVKPGIRRVDERGKGNRLMVARHCKNTIAQFYRYMNVRNGDGTYRDETPDPKCEDHLMDALRYAVVEFDGLEHVPFNPQPKRPRGW